MIEAAVRKPSGEEAGAQQPKQNSDRHEGDDTGNAMENGRYRRDWEPYRL
jgi:hypothetical protein